MLSHQPLTWHNSSLCITEAQYMYAVCHFQELGKLCRRDLNCSCAETYHWLGVNVLPHFPFNLARKAHLWDFFNSLPLKFMLLFMLLLSSHSQTLHWCLHCATSHGARTGPSEPAGDKDPSSGPCPGDWFRSVWDPERCSFYTDAQRDLDQFGDGWLGCRV